MSPFLTVLVKTLSFSPAGAEYLPPPTRRQEKTGTLRHLSQVRALDPVLFGGKGGGGDSTVSMFGGLAHSCFESLISW